MYEDFFAERLVQLRDSKGISARDMSLSIGQSRNYINMIENKKAFPSMAIFFSICEFLGVTPQEFFERGNKNPCLLGKMMDDLKRLDEKAITSIAEIIQQLADKGHQ